MSDDEEPPRKRRAVEKLDKEDALRVLLNEEIELEIGLRARLKETVESRLTWALILQDTLEKHFEPFKSDGDTTPNHFADAAIAAHRASKEASAFLTTDIFPSSLSTLVQPAPSLTSTAPAQQTEAARAPVQDPVVRPRHAPRQQLHHEDWAVKEPNKYLFLRDATAIPTMVYKLACPDCGRSDFPRLQGLLNHCRLKHHREFGSHDECVQACAVVVPEDEQPQVLELGLEVTGMSASLRRLFEMAVGSYAGIVGTGEDEEEEREEAAHMRAESEAEVRAAESTLITKTLGHHKDTPALAPFLGRAPKKRQIRAFENEDPIDVLSVGDDRASRGWTMCYQERSRVSEKDEEEASLEDEADDNDVLENAVTQSMPHVQGGSRFHVTARLAISDWSLRLSDGDVKKYEAQGGATHKWMVSIKAPSYSLHASTVLASVTVSSATEPPPAAFTAPLTVSEPPYCVMGITDKPFLARITLQWVGTRNKARQVEHWVELDTAKSARSVLGDEQVLDIELDRNTELQPRRNDAWVVDWYFDLEKRRAAQKAGRGEAPVGGAPEPDYIKRLRKLLPRFPMTAKDVGPRKPPQLPYFLPYSVEHFDGMVEGRRKAIEWGRARALWESYDASESVAPPEMQAATDVAKIAGPAGMYRWLEAEGHFPRSRPAPAVAPSKAPSKSDVARNTFCAVCGLALASHRRAKGAGVGARPKEAEESAAAAPTRVCVVPEWAGRMPLMDVQRDLPRANRPEETKRPTPGGAAHLEAVSADVLLRVIDPEMTLAVRRVTAPLRLAGFAPLPLANYGRELAPYALLAATVQVLVRRLVGGGLQAMEGGVGHVTKGAGTQGSSSRRRLLVPAHVVRGLVEDARRKGSQSAQRAMLLGLVRPGVPVSVPVLERDADADAATGGAEGGDGQTT
ncbi:hypothetical protein M0805_008821 [Coniferiporia weirii]|nr:hypothetical protein M0805_008821 [Coniferiporia weirii]